ncbi:substrate-binding periplasmic protein [Paludibacterium yongneupense]|uniref:substrate-binding periplasmic protein n=1 Tax=Paludibacterium yongneupense TaxID=400061 RepID=UPI000410FF1F|nr:transporter substrate-binding domain-containing protein [Paludibacterium yongneupense]
MRKLPRVLLFVLGLAAAACQAAPRVLDIVLSNPEYPPYLGESLPGYGLLSRIVSAAFGLEHVRVRYVFYPNNRALQAARNGVVDGSLGWAVTAERQQDLLYTDPVMRLRMVFFQRAERSIPWRSLNDLGSYRIGVTTGNSYSDEFARLQDIGMLHTEAAADDLSNFRKLLVGHIDLFPIDAEVGEMLLAQHFSAAQRLRLTYSPHSFWSADMHVVISRKQAQGPELVRRFNLGLKRLRASGEAQRLVESMRREIALAAGR